MEWVVQNLSLSNGGTTAPSFRIRNYDIEISRRAAHSALDDARLGFNLQTLVALRKKARRRGNAERAARPWTCLPAGR